MATTTYNFTVHPEDGWVQVASASGFLRVSAFPCDASFYLYVGDAAPVDTTSAIGIYVPHGKYWSNVAFSGNAYVRAPSRTIRVDVESIPAGGSGAGGPATIANGADVAEGSTTDTAYTDTTGAAAGTVISLLKGLYTRFFGVASGTTDSGNPVKVGSVFNNTLPTITTGSRADLQADGSGNLRSRMIGASITAADSVVNTALITTSTQVEQGAAVHPLVVGPYKFNGTTWDRDRKPNITSRIASTAAGGSPTVAKAGVGDLRQFWGQNAAAITYLQIYNLATTPVVGTSTPILTYPIPASAAFSMSIPDGLYLPTGTAYAFTTDVAGTTGAAAAAVTSFAMLAG